MQFLQERLVCSFVRRPAREQHRRTPAARHAHCTAPASEAVSRLDKHRRRRTPTSRAFEVALITSRRSSIASAGSTLAGAVAGWKLPPTVCAAAAPEGADPQPELAAEPGRWCRRCWSLVARGEQHRREQDIAARHAERRREVDDPGARQAVSHRTLRCRRSGQPHHAVGHRGRHLPPPAPATAASAGRIVQSGAVCASWVDIAGAISGAPIATSGVAGPPAAAAGRSRAEIGREIRDRRTSAEVVVGNRQRFERDPPEELVRQRRTRAGPAPDDRAPRAECASSTGAIAWRQSASSFSVAGSSIRATASPNARPSDRRGLGDGDDLAVVDPGRQADQRILVDHEVEQHLAGTENLCQVG